MRIYLFPALVLGLTEPCRPDQLDAVDGVPLVPLPHTVLGGNGVGREGGGLGRFGGAGGDELAADHVGEGRFKNGVALRVEHHLVWRINDGKLNI